MGLGRGSGTRSLNGGSGSGLDLPGTQEQNVREWKFWTKLSIRYAGTLKCSTKMPDQKRIWRLVFPIAILALVIGTTVGGVWHHHVNSSPDACPICHLIHQAIEPLLAGSCVNALVLIGTRPEPQYTSFTSTSDVRHIPPRAPPS